MSKRKIATSVTLVLLGLIVAGVPTWVQAAPRAQQPSENLLKNPGFEGLTCNPASPPGWCYDNWTRDTFNGIPYAEIYTPQGWVTFWSERVNPVDGRNYGRPECKVIPNQAPFNQTPKRIRSGNYAVMQFGFYRAIDSGLYQVVTGLTPHAIVQASAYAHAWTCDQDSPPLSCGDPYQMEFRVGIDPNGGTDPWSPNIIWSSGYSYDEYHLIGPVQAEVGDAGTVTVFLRATAKWSVKHNDAYWDDASLVYVGEPATPTPTPPPPPPTPTPGPSPTPLPTPTPRPDGAIVHIVQPGDTLYGIALQYGVPVEQIEQLNAGSIGPNKLIYVGQELVISVPSETPTPTPPPATPTAEASPTPQTGSVCVSAFHDRNGDGVRQADSEELLPNAVFTLSDDVGLVGQYTTDGLNEPHCFEGLVAGTYRVSMEPPAGYSASGPSVMAVALPGPVSVDVEMGAQRGTEVAEAGEETPTGEGPAPAPPEEPEGSTFLQQALRWGARVSGILLLAVAAALAVLFVLSRRRR